MARQDNQPSQLAAIDAVLQDTVKHMDEAIQSNGLPNGRVWVGAELYENWGAPQSVGQPSLQPLPP